MLLGTASINVHSKPLPVTEVYQTHCASCHGAKFEGGLGGSLEDGIWKHGESDQAIMNTIRDGLPELGMVGYGDVLSTDTLRALVVLIREQETRTHARGKAFPQPQENTVTSTQYHDYQLETIAEGLSTPWSLVFLPDGKYLVTERSGNLRIIEQDGTVKPPIQGVPQVIAHGQGGLLEVALHPSYKENGWIYLAFSDGTREGGKIAALTKVVRGRIQHQRWVDQETIWQGESEHYGSSGVHFGSRIVFIEGMLFFVIGERGGWHKAQDLSLPHGKIMRLHDDGRIPEDNPFVNTPNALPEIWSYGHRNPQGLVLHPENGSLYSTEHGPRGGDELNRILRGRNYGWPLVTHGMNYNGTPIQGSRTEAPGMESPLLHWTPSIAVCGLDVARGTAFPKWKGDLFAGGLRSEEVRRIRLENDQVIEQELIVKGIGRIRDVRFDQEGYLYLILNDPGKLVRLTPRK